MTLTLHLAGCTIEVTPGSVRTQLPGRGEVTGMPHYTASYRRTARDHGYGSDVARLNRTHEVCHNLIAHILRLPCSPVFRRVASGDHESDNLTRAEEEAVLALEKFANIIGVDLIDIAKHWSGMSKDA